MRGGLLRVARIMDLDDADRRARELEAEALRLRVLWLDLADRVRAEARAAERRRTFDEYGAYRALFEKGVDDGRR